MGGLSYGHMLTHLDLSGRPQRSPRAPTCFFLPGGRQMADFGLLFFWGVQVMSHVHPLGGVGTFAKTAQ